MNNYATKPIPVSEMNRRLAKLEKRIYEMETHQANLLQQLKHRASAQSNECITVGSACQEAKLEVRTKKNGFSSVFALNAPPQSDLLLQADRALKASARCIQLHAPSILLESNSVAIAGELTAKMSYSKPFVWRVGQKRVRMYHAKQGFPILTRIVGGKLNEEVQARLYIDPVDQYWYLEGQTGMKELESVFVGKP